MLLPAIVVAAQHPIRPVAGAWRAEVVAGATVITHDGKAWTAKEGYPLALFTAPESFGNGTVRMQFKLIDGSDDHTAGLAFGHNGTSYYYVRYNTKDGNVALWRMDGPARTVIKHGEAHEQLAKAEWHQLELTVTGRTVRATVNGRLRVEHELEAPPVGRLGLWTKPDATSAFTVPSVTPARGR
ncbi:MAG: DUF1080 domain-containing protein [Acidobacteriota bacterium]|nr:DUF1080 domain-containing protein [Acidobacteriota bacterium]